MHTLSRVCGSSFILLAAGAAQAAQTIWVSDALAKLGTVDVATGTPTTIGPIGTTLTDIAFDPSGNLWGVGGVGFQELFTVNKTTGAATLVGNMGVPVNSLVFGPDGTLWGAYANLMKIDPLTAAVTNVGPLGQQASGDIAFNGGVLYVSIVDPSGFGGNDFLASVNTATGAATVIGDIGTSGVFGMGTGPDGVLYGGVGNHIISINTTTGAGSPVSMWPIFNGSFGGVYGADFAPIPEPATLGLLSIGAVALVRRRRC
jgi:hypothetical protein